MKMKKCLHIIQAFFTFEVDIMCYLETGLKLITFQQRIFSERL